MITKQLDRNSGKPKEVTLKVIQEEPYRTAHLLVRKSSDGQLMKISPQEGEFAAIQSLPLFMDRWAMNAAEIKGPERILTATVNVTNGCPIGRNKLCGTYCFAHLSWKDSEVRGETPIGYINDMKKLRSLGVGVSIFLSTDTEPFPGEGKISDITYKLLNAMTEMPPDGLLIHSHADFIGAAKNVEILKALSARTNLIAGIGFETDSEIITSLPGHHSSVKNRIDALTRLAKAGVKTQASVTPLMGFLDFEGFVKMFHDNGIYRVMVGELRKEFGVGGSKKARELSLGLPFPSEEYALEYTADLGFPGGVALRETFYVLLP